MTLLDPQSWHDKNDTFYIGEYVKRKKLKTLLAFCMTKSDETYHHWRIYSAGTGGACVVFRRQALLARLDEYVDVTMGDVIYKTMGDMRTEAKNGGLAISKLPFLKRAGYEAEEEYRVIFESISDVSSFINFEFSINMIESIRLSPWLHKDLVGITRKIIQGIKGCSTLRVSGSTLLSNEQWKRFVDPSIGVQ